MTDEDGFQYVVKRVKPSPICFGSKIPRDTNPIGKGLSPFQKRYGNSEIYTKITPQTYHYENYTSGLYTLLNKVRSNRGVGGLASRASRLSYKFSRAPSPTRYNVPPPEILKPNKVPFNSKTRRVTIKTTTTPGPGMYNLEAIKCRRSRTQYNFGKVTVVPAYEVRCRVKPSDVCTKCRKICKMDYWHKNYTIYLCHTCMEEEKLEREMFDSRQLREFRRIRTCSFAHDHQNTTAKEFLLDEDTLNKKLRRENYLSVYIP